MEGRTRLRYRHADSASLFGTPRPRSRDHRKTNVIPAKAETQRGRGVLERSLIGQLGVPALRRGRIHLVFAMQNYGVASVC